MKVTKEMMRQLGLAKPRAFSLAAPPPVPSYVPRLVGGPVKRYGGKGQMASLVVPHFAAANVYAESCFGAGGIFFALPADVYARRAVNDLDDSIVTFFRVLRDRCDDLVRVCSLTPYSMTEYKRAAEPSTDELEEARRVWVRLRQSFAGIGSGGWSRAPGKNASHTFGPVTTARKLDTLAAYAHMLRDVAFDCVDGAEFIDTWGREETFVYVDPPYVGSTRNGTAYVHELTDAGHRRFARACNEARARGAKVAVSGYASPLYDELYAGWRRVDIEVPLHAAEHKSSKTRVESLWCSYDEREELRHTHGWEGRR